MRLILWMACAAAACAQTPDWEGVWKGSLTNFPVREGAKPVEVTTELGKFPDADGVCSRWRNTYKQEGREPMTKDYKLCRGKGPDDLYVDEGDGVKLTARWIGDVLVSPFRVDNLLLISSLRLHGDTLEEEILTVDDQPQAKGVTALKPKGIQRLNLKRQH